MYSSYLLKNDINNLFSSKVIHVCEIMTCFKNNDVIDLYRLHAIHFDTQMFVSG